MKEETMQAGEVKPVRGWRFEVGFGIILFSTIVLPSFIPIFALLGFSASFIASYTVGGTITAEILMVVGAAVSGKEGFAQIKALVFGFFRKYAAPPAKVGKIRYRIGLIMFFVPFIYGFVGPYVQEYLPQYFALVSDYSLILAIVGDSLIIISLFVLGGDFWGKLRSLFVHKAYAVLPEKPAKADAAK